MGILDDTTIFTAVMQQGGFSHAAKYLGLSNGLISRRINALEAELGVTLIKRTTRQLQLTSEGELFWQHARRIQHELDAAVHSIQSASVKPMGTIRISAPYYFGRNYLTPIITKFLQDFDDIKIDLVLTNSRLDMVKEEIDLAIRGAGYIEGASLKDSSMRMKLLIKEKIGLYASPDYIEKHGKPESVEALNSHQIIHFSQEQKKWLYKSKNITGSIILRPQLVCNDIEGNINACVAGFGIGKFTDLNVKKALDQNFLVPVLQEYNWGLYHLYIVYPQQQTLPTRTRLLLEFIHTNISSIRRPAA